MSNYTIFISCQRPKHWPYLHNSFGIIKEADSVNSSSIARQINNPAFFSLFEVFPNGNVEFFTIFKVNIHIHHIKACVGYFYFYGLENIIARNF